MNTGIQDAVNLGWKLALALDGSGGEPLLDSYDAERMPIIRRLIANTTASTKLLLWRNPLATATPNHALRMLLQIPKLQTALFDSFTGFTVSYPHSPLIAPEPREHRWYPTWGATTPATNLPVAVIQISPTLFAPPTTRPSPALARHHPALTSTRLKSASPKTTPC